MQSQNVYYTEEEECPRELTQEQKKKIVKGQCNYLLLMLMSFTAYVLSQYATPDCMFAERTVKLYNGFTVSDVCAQANLSGFDEPACETILGTHGIGFYSWMGIIPVNQPVCLSYTQFVPEVGWITPTFDAAFNAAKVFAVLANIFGAVGWLSVIFATCCPVSQERIKGLSCYFTFACICQSFTFLIHGSSACDKSFFQQYFPTVDVNNAIEEVTCSLGHGGNRSVAAAVLYGICSVLALYSIAPSPVRYSRAAGDEPTEKHSQSTDPEAQEEQQPY